MLKEGLSIAGIREITGGTYESARRYVKGEACPGGPSAKLLIAHFKWQADAVAAMLIRDRERLKNGALIDMAHGMDSDLQKVNRVWPLLTADQKGSILTDIKKWRTSGPSS